MVGIDKIPNGWAIKFNGVKKRVTERFEENVLRGLGIFESMENILLKGL